MTSVTRRLNVGRVGLFFGAALLLGLAPCCRGQGTLSFIYDQQSVASDSVSGSGGLQHGGRAFGQSFTPALAEVGFVRMQMWSELV